MTEKKLNSDTIRAFIAIGLPAAAEQMVAHTQNHFKKLNLRATWVKPRNVHLTLKFLGDISIGKAEDIKKQLKRELCGISEFRLSLTRLGVFPGWNRPRVLWIGLRDETETLQTLWRKIEIGLEREGFSRETRNFSPHLTLARIKSPEGANRLKKEAESWDLGPLCQIPVTEIKLVKSQLTPEGSVYTVMETFPLGEKPNGSTH